MSHGASGERIQTIDYAATTELPARKPKRLIIVFCLCLGWAWIVGAFTNAVSGTMSRRFFGYMTVADCVWQGLSIASFVGVAYAIVMTTAYVASTGARCPTAIVARTVGVVLAIVMACWIVGGLVGACWAFVWPVPYTVLGITDEGEFIRWRAVEGFFWGIAAGTFISLLAAPIHLHSRWRDALERKLCLAALITSSATPRAHAP